LAWHSATYAAAAVEPSCFRGLQFPEPDGPLTGLTTRNAKSCGVAGETLANAERILDARILAVDGDIELDRGTVLASRAELVVYGLLMLSGITLTGPLRPSADRDASRELRPICATLEPRTGSSP
jgi:hypothetical protein